MREFETVFIVKGQTSEREIQELTDKLVRLVSQHKGQILVNRSWGRKQLTYPMAKEKEGTYIHLDYTGNGNLIPELEKMLRLDERVIRFLTVVLQDDVDVAKRTKELADAEAALQAASPSPQ